MTTTIHKNLTGADLHEPKGVAAAALGQVYVSDGVGSGVWTTVSNLVTAGGFSTGDTKLTYKTTADAGWVMAADGSLGDGSSGATVRANADTSALFTLIWNTFSDTLAPVSTGRGVSAAADFASHKTITMPRVLGRGLGISGSGSGLTTRVLGNWLGVEAQPILLTNLPSIPLSVSGTISVVSTNAGIQQGGTSLSVQLQAGSNNVPVYLPSSVQSTGSNTLTGTAAGTGTSLPIMSPMAYINMMVKL